MIHWHLSLFCGRLARNVRDDHGGRSTVLAMALSLLVVATTAVSVTIVQGRAETVSSSKSTLGGLIGPVTEGMSARGRLARSVLHSFKAEWTVRHLTTKVPAKPDAPVAYTMKEALLVAGENYRSSDELIGCSDDTGLPPLRESGYDGRAAWSYTIDAQGNRLVHGMVDRMPLSKMSELGYVDLYGYLSEPAHGLGQTLPDSGAHVVAEEQVGEHNCYVIVKEAMHPNVGRTLSKYWVSREMGYAVIKHLYGVAEAVNNTRKAGISRHHREFSDFRQVSPGLWLPCRFSYVRETQMADGTWQTKESQGAHLDTFQLNPRVTDSDFQLPR